MNAKFPIFKIKYIIFSLLALLGEQCFSQYFSHVYKSPLNADTYISDFIILKDSIYFFSLNRSCINGECSELYSLNSYTSKVNNYLTAKELRFNPLLYNSKLNVSYTTIKDNNVDSNYWHIDLFTNDLQLRKTLSFKSPDGFFGGNYGIYNYKNNYLLFGVGLPTNYPYYSPSVMIANADGKIIMPMTFYPYDTLNPEIHNLEGVYMLHDTAFYYSYQIGKQPFLGQYFYKLNADGTSTLKWYLRRFNTRPLRFLVDDDNNLVSFVSTMNSKSVVIYKNDKDGNQLWSKQLPEQFSGQDHFVVNDIIPCKNGDILVSTWAELFDTLSTGEIYNPLVIYLARLTKDGDLRWIRRLSQRGFDGKWKSSSGNKLIEADNGDILIGGSINREEAIGGYDAWFMRLSANGCLSDECIDEYVTEIGGEIITSTHNLNNSISRSKELKAYPNPSSNKIKIDMPEESMGLYHYQIFNSKGQMMEQSTVSTKSQQLEIDLGKYESDIYHILIKSSIRKELYKAIVMKI